MRSRRPWRRLTAAFIATGLAGVTAPAYAVTATAGPAPLPELTYVQNGNLYAAGPDGSNPHVLVTGGVTGTPAWFGDGSQIAYVQNGDLFLSTADGKQVRQITTDGQASEPVAESFYVPRVLFQDAGAYYMAAPDPGMGTWNYPITGTDATESPNGIDLYVSPDGDLSTLYFTSTPTDIQGRQPAFSPDGSEVAYVDPATNQLAVRSFGQPQGSSDFVFGSPTTVTADTGADAHPRWSADGKSLMYENGGNILTVSATASAATGTVLVPNASGPTDVTLQPKHVVREWGGNAINTAIAVSQRNYRSVDATGTDNRFQANGVVLSRSDTFSDALVGSAFANEHGTPLLLTKSTALDPAVLAEIQRVLPRGFRVYLLGGTSALSAGIETQLNNLGFRTTRFAGSNMFDTAVKIEQAQTSGSGITPFAAFVATGSSYYDALAAGPVSVSTSSVVVLSKGGTSNPTLPAESAAYLNSLTPYDPATGQGTQLVGVGGPGYKAIVNALASGQLSNWPKNTPVQQVVGSNAEETALALARFDQPSLSRIGVATVSDWHDALAGGASVSALLLTPKSGLYAHDALFLAQNSPSIGEVDVFGGTAALSDQVVTDAQPQIGSSQVVDYLQVTPGNVPPIFLNTLPRTNTARTNAVRPNAHQRAAARLK